MRLARLIRGMSALLAGGLAAAGCAAGQPHAAKVASQREHVRIGVLNSIDAAPVYIARERGYFADEGLDVDVIAQQTPVQPGGQASPLDTADVAFIDYVTMFRLTAARPNLRLVADAYQLGLQTQPLLAMPESSVKTARDLAGKTIGVLAPENIQVLLINELAKAHGIDPKTLRYVVVAPPAMGAALKSGRVNVAADIEPFTTQIESGYGAEVVADTNSGATQSVPLSGYVSTDVWQREHRAAFDAMRRAMQRAAADAAQRSVVEHVLTADVKIDPRTAVTLKIGGFPTSVNATRLKRVVDLMTEAGVINKPIDLAKLIN